MSNVKHRDIEDAGLHRFGIISDTDPESTYGTSATGTGTHPGLAWIETATGDLDTIVALKVRNQANDGWNEVPLGASSYADDVELTFGTGSDYAFAYDSAAARFEFRSTDVDGAGADGVVFYVDDGQDAVTFTDGIRTGNASTFGGNVDVTTGYIRGSNGSAASPSLQPGVDADTGFYWVSANVVGVTAGGTQVARFTSTFMVFDQIGAEVLIGGAAATNVFRMTESTRGNDLYPFAVHSDMIDGDQVEWLAQGETATSGTRQAGVGIYKHPTITNPAGYLRLVEEDGTVHFLWMRSSALRRSTNAAHIGTTSGTEVGSGGGGGGYVAGDVIAAASGTAAAPGLTFDGDLDNGMYLAATDKPAISANGVEQIVFGDYTTGGTFPRWKQSFAMAQGDRISFDDDPFFGDTYIRSVVNNTLSFYAGSGSAFLEGFSTYANFPKEARFASTVIMSGLPTSDPANTGELWNNSGVLNVS